MAFSKVIIQVLTYNGHQWIEQCLKTLTALEYLNFTLQVVDNASTDGTSEWIVQHYPGVRLIHNSHNIGFGAGHNVGIKMAIEDGAEYIWLINQDTWVASDALTKLVEIMEKHPEAGMVSPVILLPNGKEIWFGDGRIDWLRMRSVHTVSESLSEDFETEYISGCAPLLRVSTLQKIRLFDERFFLYYEDADLSLRLRQTNWKLLIVPGSRVFHAEASITDNPHKLYWLVYSGLIFFRKHTPLLWRFPQALYLFLRRLKNRFDLFWNPTLSAREVARAYRDFFAENHK